MTTISKRFWPRLLTAVIVAIGVGVAWGMFVGWAASLWTTNFAQSNERYESLYMTEGGEFVINSYEYWPVYRDRYRTLDGQPRPENFWTLWQASLSGERGAPWVRTPIKWSAGIQSIYDEDRIDSGTIWYAVPDDRGRLYFEGYDQASRILVGYISRKGFAAARPARADRFDLRYADWTGQMAGWALRNDPYFGSITYDPLRGQVYPWRTYLIDDERVVEVDVRKRTVRTILDDKGALSLSPTTYPTSLPAPDERPPALEPGARAPQRPLNGAVVVRYADHVAAWNPTTEKRKDFPIPEEIRRDKRLTLYRPEEGSVWFQSGPGPGGDWRVAELRHIDGEGKLLDRKTVELAGRPPTTERQEALSAVPFAPVPLGWVVFTPLVPLGKVFEGFEPTYGVAFVKTLANVWPALLIVLVAGIFSAIAVAKLQRRHFRDHTAAWVITTFLAGPAMLVAYLVEHRGDPTAKCRECSSTVPARRDACANCGTLFPEAPLKGTEIFA